jgi:RNA polymerase sigma-70 factor (ECF subfamily)
MLTNIKTTNLKGEKMKVHYEFSRDGITGARNYSDVEVTEELGQVLMELDRQEYNINRAETRRHESLNCNNDKWDILVDPKVDVEADVFKSINSDILKSIISTFKVEEQKIIYWLYLSEKPLSQLEISKILDISENAVKQRAKYIRTKLKDKLIKYF